VGSKILPIDVKDPDLTGMELSVNCSASHQVIFVDFFMRLLNDKENEFFSILCWMKSKKKHDLVRFIKFLKRD